MRVISQEIAEILGVDWQTPEDAHADAIARGADCHRCPLWGQQQGPVMGQIRSHARLTIIGEAPGGHEVLEGVPFVGPSGKDLDKSLEEGGLTRADCSITNTLLCRPPEEMQTWLHRLKITHEMAVKRAEAAGLPAPEAPASPLECCAPRLRKDVAESGAPVVLAVGSHALRATAEILEVPFGEKKSKPGEPRINKLKRQIGAPVKLAPDSHATTTFGTKVVMASYHPAFAMRKGSRQYRPVVRQHMARAARIAARDAQVDWTEPQFILAPTIEQVEATCELFLRAGARVSVDIETDGINTRKCMLRCVGLGAEVDGRYVIISVPFRRRDGTNYWTTPEEKIRAVRAVQRVLDQLELLGHNLAFDTAVLLRVGLLASRKKKWFDTMLSHHDTDDNDLPHDLSFVMARHFESPQWKMDVDAKSVDGIDDDIEWKYNCRDVFAVMKLVPELEAKMAQLGTCQQFVTDTDIAPICRDMGELGLVVDRHERLRLLRSLTDEVRWRIKGRQAGEVDAKGNDLAPIKGLCALTGDSDFNPRATALIREYLYERKGLKPIFNTHGKDWGEGEDPSTNTASLLALLAKGVDAETKQFIDTLFEFRAYDKLKGTYVKNLDYVKEDWGWAGLGKLAVLHTNYKAHVIPSGRLSTAPAIQNWPERGRANMRKMITSPPGYVIVGADFDQLELRLYAVIARDMPLYDAFLSSDQWGPKDIHVLNYAALEAKNESEIAAIYDRLMAKGGKDNKDVKQLRNIAKRFVYLETYGGEPDKLFQVMSTERDKATMKLVFPHVKPDDVKRWHDNWHKWHPATKGWQEACKRLFYQHGYTASILDFRKRFHPGGLNKQNAIANHVIQASGAALANRALCIIAEKIPFRGWGPFSGLMLQIHDYLGCYVPEGRADEAKKIIEDAMCYTYEGMPFTATAKASKCWAEQ